MVPAVQDSGQGVNAVDASEAAAAAARLQQAAQDVAVTQQQLALLEVGGAYGQQIGQLIGKVDADVAKQVHSQFAPNPGWANEDHAQGAQISLQTCDLT